MAGNYKQIKVNLSSDDHSKLSNQAKEMGISIAELFRRSVGAEIDHAPVRRGSAKKDPSIPHDLIYQVAMIGNNLNQIARYVNTEKVVDRVVADQLIGIRRKLSQVLGDGEEV